MSVSSSYFKLQYQLVQQSRSALFDYCKTIAKDDFLTEHQSFGHGGSIRNIFVHVANTYEFWILNHALKKDIAFTGYIAKTTMKEIEELFNYINDEIFTFISIYNASKFAPITLKIKGTTRNITAFELFTHVITHEFHHKGQILSLSRHLGYIPKDTDILR